MKRKNTLAVTITNRTVCPVLAGVKKALLISLLSTLFPFCLFGQAASRTDGQNIYYYDTIHDAAASISSGGTINMPNEITLLKDIILSEPFEIADGIHIRLVPGNADKTIHRSANLLDHPVLWVTGSNASLTLGKPGMDNKLIIDGGYRNDTPVIALSPLVVLNGQHSKLIMYDNVIIQNNYNNANAPGNSTHQNGAGVFMRTTGENSDEHKAEFIMKGGIIQGNSNFVQTPIACGGGVFISGAAVFTMEGGVIMNNTANISGGGVHTGSRGSFYKTGGIIYGKDAPSGLRNTALIGVMTPKTWPSTIGHAVCVANPDVFFFRNDTSDENDNLSFTGAFSTTQALFYGEGDKWNNSITEFRRALAVIIVSALVLSAVIIFVIVRITVKKRIEKVLKKSPVPEIDLSGHKLSVREEEICTLLLTELSIKQISYKLGITYSGINYHIKNLYRKLEIESRPELFVKLGLKG
ncbi:MAG: helix-turn-helix transcriptional regulator [Treponema sp.]|jgi:DNA-binding CsgD family transcriptional regulator|nr:helix-turn-helix transcriptional regulator [Treponema sp.]